jgi:hypothetical protein
MIGKLLERAQNNRRAAWCAVTFELFDRLMEQLRQGRILIGCQKAKRA